jgi:two-component system response regulator HydG
MMSDRSVDLIQLVLIGSPSSEFRLAAEMAGNAGAQVSLITDPSAALSFLREAGADLVMIDVAMDAPGFLKQLRSERIAVPVLACGIHASAELAVGAIRAGALDYIPLPPQSELIAAAIVTMCQRVCSPIGEDPTLVHALSYARAIAPSDAAILIAGETGSGKQVTARMVHEASGRKGRFLVVECEGVAAQVIESELFGHEAGAFPGAVARRLGRIEEAAGGTVFIREIGAMPPAVQARLAAALMKDAGRSSPIQGDGSSSTRLIASTSGDLAAQVCAGTFRADLLARLDLLRIEIPPLRARGDDIGRLAVHFAENLAVTNCLPVRPLSREALERLKRHEWSGNVRELQDVIHRAVLLAGGSVIDKDALVLPDGCRIGASETASGAAEAHRDMASLVGRSVAEVERELILQTLERCGGNRTSASTILGISVRTMRNKLKSFIEAGIAISPAA